MSFALSRSHRSSGSCKVLNTVAVEEFKRGKKKKNLYSNDENIILHRLYRELCSLCRPVTDVQGILKVLFCVHLNKIALAPIDFELHKARSLVSVTKLSILGTSTAERGILRHRSSEERDPTVFKTMRRATEDAGSFGWFRAEDTLRRYKAQLPTWLSRPLLHRLSLSGS